MKWGYRTFFSDVGYKISISVQFPYQGETFPVTVVLSVQSQKRTMNIRVRCSRACSRDLSSGAQIRYLNLNILLKIFRNFYHVKNRVRLTESRTIWWRWTDAQKLSIPLPIQLSIDNWQPENPVTENMTDRGQNISRAPFVTAFRRSCLWHPWKASSSSDLQIHTFLLATTIPVFPR